MSPTGYTHGITEMNIADELRRFVRKHSLGTVMVGEVGIYIRRDPDTVRAADVLYISRERLAAVRSDSFLDTAPELIVEVMSPGDRWGDVMDKLDEYFSIGVLCVWLADPRHQQIFVYTSPTDARRFSADEILSGGELLPGFSVQVKELFRQIP